MSLSNIALRPDKAALRFATLTRRDALHETQRAEAAQAIAARAFPLALRPGTIVSGYAPIRSEIDPTPLMQVLAAHGARLTLPAIIGPDQPLQFRSWTPGDKLVRGQLGIMEPPVDAAQSMPDIVLVPLAAFDRAGHRVGYGAGHYDRSLEQLKAHKPVLAVGLAFALQEIDTVPTGPHDARLDLVLTEQETIDFRSF